MNNRNMRHFLYLDHDLVDSIIAQENKGLITGVSENTGIKHEEKSSSKLDSHVNPEINAGLAKILSGKISAGLEGELASGTELIASDSKVITKILLLISLSMLSIRKLSLIRILQLLMESIC